MSMHVGSKACIEVLESLRVDGELCLGDVIKAARARGDQGWNEIQCLESFLEQCEEVLCSQEHLPEEVRRMVRVLLDYEGENELSFDVRIRVASLDQLASGGSVLFIPFLYVREIFRSISWFLHQLLGCTIRSNAFRDLLLRIEYLKSLAFEKDSGAVDVVAKNLIMDMRAVVSAVSSTRARILLAAWTGSFEQIMADFTRHVIDADALRERLQQLDGQIRTYRGFGGLSCAERPVAPKQEAVASAGLVDVAATQQISGSKKAKENAESMADAIKVSMESEARDTIASLEVRLEAAARQALEAQSKEREVREQAQREAALSAKSIADLTEEVCRIRAELLQSVQAAQVGEKEAEALRQKSHDENEQHRQRVAEMERQFHEHEAAFDVERAMLKKRIAVLEGQASSDESVSRAAVVERPVAVAVSEVRSDPDKSQSSSSFSGGLIPVPKDGEPTVQDISSTFLPTSPMGVPDPIVRSGAVALGGPAVCDADRPASAPLSVISAATPSRGLALAKWQMAANSGAKPKTPDVSEPPKRPSRRVLAKWPSASTIEEVVPKSVKPVPNKMNTDRAGFLSEEHEVSRMVTDGDLLSVPVQDHTLIALELDECLSKGPQLKLTRCDHDGGLKEARACSSTTATSAARSASRRSSDSDVDSAASSGEDECDVVGDHSTAVSDDERRRLAAVAEAERRNQAEIETAMGILRGLVEGQSGQSQLPEEEKNVSQTADPNAATGGSLHTISILDLFLKLDRVDDDIVRGIIDLGKELARKAIVEFVRHAVTTYNDPRCQEAGKALVRLRLIKLIRCSPVDLQETLRQMVRGICGT